MKQTIILIATFFLIANAVRVNNRLRSEAKSSTSQSYHQTQVANDLIDFGRSGARTSVKLIATTTQDKTMIDTGSGFQVVTTPEIFRAVDINTAGTSCAVSTVGNIYTKSISGSWTHVQGWAADCSIADDGTLFVIGGPGTLYKHLGGANWHAYPGISGAKRISALNVNEFYFVNSANMLQSYSGGVFHNNNVPATDVHTTADNSVSVYHGSVAKMFTPHAGWHTFNGGDNYQGIGGYWDDYHYVYQDKMYRVQFIGKLPHNAQEKTCTIRTDKRPRYIGTCGDDTAICTFNLKFDLDIRRQGFSDLYAIANINSKVYIASDNNHSVRVWERGQVGDWEKWRFVDAGNNRFCIRSHSFLWYIRVKTDNTFVAGYGCWAEEKFEVSCI